MRNDLDELLPKSGLAFIATQITAPPGLQVPLGADAVFRRCTPREIEILKPMISRFGAGRGSGLTTYDLMTTVTRHEGAGVSSRTSQLAPEEARYYGIGLTSGSAFCAELKWALNLCNPRLTSPVQMFFPASDKPEHPISWSWYGNSIDSLRCDDPATEPEPITKHALQRAADIRLKIEELPKSAAFIRASLARHDAVLNSRSDHGLVVVGLFSIIEGLITHRPRVMESLASIGHQIRTKLALLQNRFETPIEPAEYFPDAKIEKLWSLLYDYRSCIAHGDHPDFAGSLRHLKGPRNVVEFLTELIRELAITCITEPALVTDLKAC